MACACASRPVACTRWSDRTAAARVRWSRPCSGRCRIAASCAWSGPARPAASATCRRRWSSTAACRSPSTISWPPCASAVRPSSACRAAGARRSTRPWSGSACWPSAVGAWAPSPAASASACCWPRAWYRRRNCWCWTNRCRPSTRAASRSSSGCCWTGARPASPCSGSSTTWRPSAASPTGSAVSTATCCSTVRRPAA